MKNDFTRTAEDMLAAAKEGRIPAEVQAFVSESVAQGRKAFEAAKTVATEHARTTGGVLASVQTGAKEIGDKMLANTTANTEAFFDAASQVAKATTVPEALRLQAEFVKSQMASAVAQSQELFALSTKVAQSTAADVQAATAKVMKDVTKAA
ncbi:MAG TPA: phasin family protein [Hyphomicrobiaceae bacterium]|nr:phasin family protein [Hyphomicrobiaceae bacterium]